MSVKTPAEKAEAIEQVAEAIDKMYGDEPIGSDLSSVLEDKVKSIGLKDPAEIQDAKKEIGRLLRELRNDRLRMREAS